MYHFRSLVFWEKVSIIQFDISVIKYLLTCHLTIILIDDKLVEYFLNRRATMQYELQQQILQQFESCRSKIASYHDIRFKSMHCAQSACPFAYTSRMLIVVICIKNHLRCSFHFVQCFFSFALLCLLFSHSFVWQHFIRRFQIASASTCMCIQVCIHAMSSKSNIPHSIINISTAMRYSQWMVYCHRRRRLHHHWQCFIIIFHLVHKLTIFTPFFQTQKNTHILYL